MSHFTRSPASSSGALSTGQTWTCWSGARGDHKNNQRDGIPLLGGQAERVGVVQPGEEKAPGRPYCGFQYLKGVYKKDGERLCSKPCSNRTRSKGFKLKKGSFRLDIRKNFFTVRVVRQWNRLPREVIGTTSLETFKVRLDGALSILIWLKMSLLTAGGLG